MIKIIPKVMITGGAGFIGSTLANELSQKGYTTIVIDNLKKGKKENLSPGVKFKKADICDKYFPQLLKAIRPDCIFHLAAQSSLSESIKNPTEDFSINFTPIIEILKTAKEIKLKKLIFSSSAAVYGISNHLPTKEEEFKNPISIYGLSKLSSEYYINYFSNLFKIPAIILRYANVYGPKQDFSAEGGVVAIFAKRMVKKEHIIIFGTGEQTRDFIEVSDIISANILALEKDILGDFNVGTGIETSVNQLFVIMGKISGQKQTKKTDSKEAYGVSRSSLFPGKLKSHTNWRPKITLENGLKNTYKYFESKL